MPATRHLSRALAEAALRRGRGVEQLLSLSAEADGSRRVRWVSISAGHEREYVLRAHDVRDAGPPTWFDVDEFAPVDEDEAIGEGRVLGTYEEPAVAISAAEELGADPDRWVNEGVVGDEYREAVT